MGLVLLCWCLLRACHAFLLFLRLAAYMSHDGVHNSCIPCLIILLQRCLVYLLPCMLAAGSAFMAEASFGALHRFLADNQS